MTALAEPTPTNDRFFGEVDIYREDLDLGSAKKLLESGVVLVKLSIDPRDAG